MGLRAANFRLLCGRLRIVLVAAGPGRATAYLIDPVREHLIALKQWEMLPRSLPLSSLPPTVFSHFSPLSHLSSASLPFSPYFSPCFLPPSLSLPLPPFLFPSLSLSLSPSALL